jgi:hypothetical protein
MLKRFGKILFLLAIFFLPWQTAMILTSAMISGEPSQYGVFSVYVVEVMIAFSFVLRGRRQTDQDIRRTWQALYWFLAIAFFSLSFGSIVGVGWFHMVHVVAAAMLFMLITDERTVMKRVLTVFLFGLLVPIMLAWIQVVTGASPDSSLLGISSKDVATSGVAVVETAAGRLMRAYGTFPHPNIFGGYLAFGVIALAWLSRFIQNKRYMAAALLVSTVLSATFIVTFSRSAWLALFTALLVLIVMMFWQKKLPPRRVIPIMALGLASIISTFIFFHSQVISRFDPSQRLEAVSIEERASQYQTVQDVFWEAPLLGVGPSAYTFTLERLNPGHPVWFYQPIHNVFLLILAELGVVGGIAFFYWVYCMDMVGHTHEKKPGGMFAITAGTCLLVIGLFDHYLWSLWPGLALWALACGSMVKWGSEA